MRIWLLVESQSCRTKCLFCGVGDPLRCRLLMRNERAMCSTPCCPALHVSLLPSVQSISSLGSSVSRTHFGAHVGASLRSHSRPVRSRERVARIRGLAGEGGASEKEETRATGENGKSGAAVTDAAAGASSKGFGASMRAGPAKSAAGTKEKKKPTGTIRRSAPQQPLLQSAPAENQMSQIETAYVASLTFLFGLIFVEGIVLAASGFLPEDWDEFLVKTLYPSFTPTVGLFLLAAAGYGVFKYLGLGPSKE